MATKEKTTTYTVQLVKHFELPTRWRAGRQFVRNEPQVLELTKEEAEAIKNDRYMEIKKGAPKDKTTDAPVGDGNVLPPAETGTTDTTVDEATDTQDDNDVQTGDTDEEETTSDEAQTSSPTVEEKAKLLQKSRKRINQIAKSVGIENAETLATKEDVANAILAKQGE